MAKKKKKVTKKKITKKKIVRRKSQKNTQGVMAIIPYSEIVKPETYKGKYSIVPTTFNQTQILAIIARTPERVVKQRPGKGGGTWDYVPGWWFKKKLNFVFGFDGWDTIIDGERIDGDYITVKGRLIIRSAKTGKEIVSKQDYGGAEIKYLKGKTHTPQNYLDISNDFKAAQTDLVKRCCVQLGFAMDIYGKQEMQSIGVEVQQNGNGGVGGGGNRKIVETEAKTSSTEKGIWSEITEIRAVLITLGHKTPAAQLKQVEGFAKFKGFKFDGWRMTQAQAKEMLSKVIKNKIRRKLK